MTAISWIACAPHLTEQVYQRLLHAICDGELAPGARLTQAVLQTAGVCRVVWDEHEAILRAINHGDADRAERLARHHGERAGHNLVAQLTRHARTLPEHPAAQEETP